MKKLCFVCPLQAGERYFHTTWDEPYSAALYCLTDSLTGSDLKAKGEIAGKREGEKSQSGFRSFGRNESLHRVGEQRMGPYISCSPPLSLLFSKCEGTCNYNRVAA